MNDLNRVPDADVRFQATDPACSFIVQAPAGSGKTGLLIQRYLRLLACVDEPEEIIAITFTRKAAAEMRERILNALGEAEKAAGSSISPENTGNGFEQQTLELAVAALQRDHKNDWRIVENPARLRIQTIDSLCASLTQQMPVLSKFGSQPEITENATELYLEAARATIAMLNQDHFVANDIEKLLGHLDNDIARFENLLVGMLARRDHWLRHVHGKPREELEASLAKLRQDTVEHVKSLIAPAICDELMQIMRYAAANLLMDDKSTAITACDGLTVLPDTVEQWLGIAELLLKKDGDWRSSINKNQGFPPGKTKVDKECADAWKKRVKRLIEILSVEDELRQVLLNIQSLPPSRYSEAQWEILGAITCLLPIAVAQLKIVFQSTGQVDFTEVSQSALTALGGAEEPTDLALALDYQIKHLLIDEFQDTSISQYQLIEKLTAAWEINDGRSVFAVGDPMQSIYRFREAEVGLFLQTRQAGIGNIKLKPVTLSSNFRSQSGIVDWVNHAFKQIMPRFEDVAVGAVAYTPSFAVHAELPEQAVTVHPIYEKNRVIEAQRVIDVVVQSQQKNPDNTVAILVRNRSHLNEIIRCLQQHEVRFHAVDIDALDKKPLVQDLLMLTRALLNPADRLAWLSVLRAPWCGLQLDDLQALVSVHGAGQKQTIWQLIRDEQSWPRVYQDAVERLRRIIKVLEPCLTHRYRQSLRQTVEAAWQALGGPGYVRIKKTKEDLTANDLNDAAIFFKYLEQHEKAGRITDLASFEEGLTRLFAAADLDVNTHLQIMTIHKSKGLEFDTVIVPGLGYVPKNNDRQLLNWIELPRSRPTRRAGKNVLELDETDLFLAPIQAAGQENDAINQWIASVEQEKENYESERLLYVAATRAKKILHFFGHVDMNVKGEEVVLQQPKSGSLLKRLWPAVESIFRCGAIENQQQIIQKYQTKNSDSMDELPRFSQTIYRLPVDWRLPQAPEPIRWQSPLRLSDTQEDIEYSWAGEVARHIGSIVHRWLQQMAEDQLVGWSAQRVQSMREKFRYGLLSNGFSADDETLDQAVDRVVTALIYTLIDPRGQWILGEQQEARNELRLTGIINDKTMDYVIDRTFCDEHNRRWIIDYKTSGHEGAGLAVFLDREQERYRHQLDNYAAFFQKIDARPICLGLYFPMLKGWREWVYQY